MISTPAPWKRDAAIWAALLLLVAGLGLMDRSFATWRNHRSNLHDASGQRYLPNPITGPLRHPAVVGGVALTGLSMLALSVVLFARKTTRAKIAQQQSEPGNPR